MFGVISDTHANLEALDAVLAVFAARGITDIYSAGDIVGYNAAPNACCERLRAIPVRGVMGNHDWAVLRDPAELDWFNRVARMAIDYTVQHLTPANREYLAALPTRLAFVAGGRRVTIVHGSPEDPLMQYEDAEAPDAWFAHLLDLAEADILVMGHTHLPFVRRIGHRLVVNPGSVGQPRDGDPRSSCAIIDPATLQAEILRLAYDVKSAVRRVTAAGLPVWLADRLGLGL